MCRHLLAPEQSEKAIQMFFWQTWNPLNMDSHIFMAFLAYFEKNKPEMIQLFGVGTNSMLIALNTC